MDEVEVVLRWDHLPVVARGRIPREWIKPDVTFIVRLEPTEAGLDLGMRESTFLTIDVLASRSAPNNA